MDLTIFESDASPIPPTVPASPSSGFPVNGNPGGGIAATIPGAYWAYQIVKEIDNIMQQVGVTPDHTQLDQLFDAIQRMTSVSQTVHKLFVQPSAIASTPTPVEWDVAGVTQLSMWSLADPTKMIVPANFNAARCIGGCGFERYSSYERHIRFFKNGALFDGSPGIQIPPVATGGYRDFLNIVSPWVPVVPGDYFELIFQYPGTVQIDIGNDANSLMHTWMMMEVKTI